MTSTPSITVAEALGCMPNLIANSLGDRVLERCLAMAGLPGNISEKLGFYIPEVALNRFLDSASRSAGDDLFGLYLAERLSVKEYGTWGDYVLEASNLLAALNRAVCTIHLHADKDKLEIWREPRSIFFRYTFGERTSIGYRQTALAALGAMLSVPRHFLGSQWRPLSIGLDLGETSSEPRIEARVGTKVLSDRQCIFLEIANSDLPTKNPYNTDRCTTIGDVKRACRGGPPPKFVPFVEQLVMQRLGSEHISLDDIARIMDISRRTLQRRIDGSGTSFRSIYTDAKMRKAEELLAESSATISSIALQLDYSTASHFSRAFRKRFGTTPIAFRNSKLPSN